MRNVKDPADKGFTPYQLCHTGEFKGRLVPFGAMVQYKPSAKREVGAIKKFDSRMVPGIFIGYHLHAGGRWSGDYLVLDAEAYRKRMEGANIPIHRIKEIHLGDSMRFPVKDGTIESLPSRSWDTVPPSEDKDMTVGTV